MDPGGQSTCTTRLMITRMVLENFKSYAGEQEIGPFHKRFSSIVGPNGSGKSNVIDALLFVFGKRAKQLRLNKVSELIHKSSRFPNLEYAKVAVYFQLIHDDESSEDEYEVVPGSEFVVSRTAFKNNQSKYSVDGKNSTYTEVGQLLRQHDIDLDNNRFLILQGEVEQISMMKPKALTPHEDGFLEYLEDIIGSNRYVPQIEAAGKTVEELNEVRLERVKRLQISQADRDNLEGPRTEASEYLEKEAGVRHKHNVLYQIYTSECAANIEGLTEKLEGYQEKLVYERNKLKDTEKELKVMQTEYSRINAEYDRLTAEMQQTADEFTAYERRDTKMIEDMKFLKTQIQKLTTTIKKESAKEEECSKEVAKIQSELDSMRTGMAEVEARKMAAEKHLDDVMSSLQESTASLRTDLEEVQSRLTEADRSVATLQTEKESVETSVEILQSRSQAAHKSVAAAEARLSALEIEEQQIVASRQAAVDRKAALQARLAALTSAIDRLKEQQTELQGSVRTAISACEEAKASRQAQQSSNGGGSRAQVQSIMKQTCPGGALAGRGVRGRLGDLGSIAPEYDVAISTACGCLDYIVVDNADSANACISYLRESNNGRASFIVLEQIGHYAAKIDACPAIPAGMKRLFDLITPKDHIYRNAFYMGLKDTLVTDNWDLATRVAYEGDRVKWRVVTTDGNLIDTSGAMTGGGKVAKSGGMKAHCAADTNGDVSQQQIDALEEEISRKQAALAASRSELSDTEKELKETQQALKKIQVELEKGDMQVTRVASEREDISARLPALRAACKLSKEEVQEMQSLEARLCDIDARMKSLSPDRVNLQDQVKAIQNQIREIGGPKLKRAQSKVDQASSEFDACNSSISAKEVALSTATKQGDKAMASRSKAEAELEKSKEKWTALEEEQRQMEVEAEAVLLAQENAKAAATAKEKELKEISDKYKASEDVVRTVREVEVDLRSNVDNCTKLLKENESRRAAWQKELDKVRKHHADDAREYGALFTTASDGGAEECKEGNMEVEGDETSHGSLIVKPLVDLSTEELDKMISLAARTSKKGRDRQDVDEDEERTEKSTRKYGIEVLKREINLMEADRDRLRGSVNLTALSEYRRKDDEFRSRLGELEEVTSQRNAARKEYEDLRRKRLEEFMSGFGTITLKLKEMYQMITLGGDAELELVDSLDPFSEGIVFSVRPPKKSWKNISNLSGGEKTLSSLALVFALHHFKPTPLYVMDEIDAALDFKNVSIVANYIKDRTKNAQFVIISLRNNMFELANRLVGIYKTHDMTKSVTINPHSFSAAVAGKNDRENVQRVNTKFTSEAAVASGEKMVLGDSTNKRN